MTVKKSPKVSIIINSYKDINKLKLCVEAARRTQYDDKEVIVVSYGLDSTSIEASRIKSYIDELILLEKDLGPPAQRNIGFKVRDAKAKYVLFIDDDVILTESTVKNLVKILEKYPSIGIAQPVLLSLEQSIDCAGAFIDFLGYTYVPFRGKHISFFSKKAEYIAISYAASACMILRVNFFDNDINFQPFDREFYFNYEDADLCLRTWIQGIKVVCVLSATAIHKRGRTASLKQLPEHLVYLNTRNKFITLVSVYDMKTLLTYIPFFIIFEFIKAVYLLKINSTHALSTFKAILWCLHYFKNIWLRRKLVMKKSIKNSVISSVIYKPIFPALIHEFKIHYNLI